MKASPFNRFLLSVTVLLTSTASVFAQNIWTGSTSGAINASGNYQAGSSVASDGNASGTFVFGRVAATNRAITVSQEFKANQLQFESNGGGGFTLSGSFLNFIGSGNGIFQNSSQAVTISSGIKVSDGPLTLGGTGTGLITLSGTTGNDFGGKGITKSGTSAFLITQALTNTGALTISGGTLAFSGSGNIATAYQLRGGVVATSGTFSRALGTGATSVNFGAGGGGFAAYGGALTVSTALGTYAATNTGNGLALGRPLILGSSIADNVVTLTSNIGLAGAAREIRLVDNSNSANDSAVLSGIISGTAGGGLNLTGAGNLALSNTNTYTGVTTIGSGVTLSVATINDGGVAGNLGQAASTASNLVLSGGTLRYTGATASTNRNFTLTTATSSSIHVSEAANALTISGASANTTGALNKTGAGTLILSGLNLHTGLTTVSNGTLRYGITNALSSGGVTVSGGTLDIATFNDTVGAVSMESGSITGTTGALTGTSYAFQSGTVSAILDGAGALTKSSAGNVVLSGANNYSGATSITGGILNIRNATALGTTAGATSVSSGAALELQGDISVGAEALTLSGTGVSNAGALRNISGANTFGGLLTLGAASRINSDAGTLTLSNAGTITGATFGLTVGGAGDTTINSVIGTTSGTLTKDGTGTLILTGANTFTGLTSITGGVLNMRNASALGTTAGSTAVSSGAALELQGDISVGAEALTLSGTGVSNAGALRNVSGANTYSGLLSLGAASRINSDAGTLTLSNAGTITGATFGLSVGGAGNITINSVIGTTSGTLSKDGAGTLILTGANTFTGLTSITGGVLNMRNATALGTTAGATSVSSGAALELQGDISVGAEALTLSGTGVSNAGVLRNISGANTFGGLLTLGAASRINSDAGTLTLSNAGTITGATFGLTVGGAGNITINSVIGTTSGALSKEGTGTLTLTGANTFSGQFTVGNGTLSIATINNAGANGTLGNSANAVLLGSSGNTGTLEYTGTTASTTKPFSAAAGGTAALNVTNAGTTLTYSASLGGSGNIILGGAGNHVIGGGIGSSVGSLTKNGAGALTLSGLGHGGGFAITQGRLNVNNDSAFGNSTSLNLASGVTIDNTSGSAVNVTNTGLIKTLGSSLIFAGTRDLSLGTGRTNLTSNITFDINAGNLTLAGDVTGSFGITKVGAGTLTLGGLSGSSTYTGNTVVNGGELSLTGSSTFANNTQITVANGAFLRVGSGSTLSNVVINSRPEGLIFQSLSHVDAILDGSGTLSESFTNIDGQQTINSGVVISAAADYFGSDPGSLVTDRVVLSDNSTIQVTQAFSMSANKGVRITSGQATIQTDANLVMANPITGDGGLVKSGFAQLTISGINDFKGDTRVDAGRLVIGNSGSLGANSNVSVVSGSDIVVDGTVNGSLFIDQGATLSGSGTIAGSTTVSGVHSPGNSPGIQTTGNLTYNNAAAITWELASNTSTQGNPVAFDQIVVNGDLNFAGSTSLSLVFNLPGSTVDWSDSFWESNQTWTLFDVSGTTTDVNNLTIGNTNFADRQGALLDDIRTGSFFTLNLQGSDVLLSYTAVPESSVTLLGGLSALLLLRRRRNHGE